MQLHEKFRGRGVEFVSLTQSDKEAAERFTKGHGIGWLTMYGVKLESMNSLGVLDPNALTLSTTGMEVTPTIYILNSEGRVLWSDKGFRTMHPDIPSMIDDLDSAIEAALLPSPAVES